MTKILEPKYSILPGLQLSQTVMPVFYSETKSKLVKKNQGFLNF